MTLTCGICLPLLAESGKPGKRGVRETGKVPELLKIQMLSRNKLPLSPSLSLLASQK